MKNILFLIFAMIISKSAISQDTLKIQKNGVELSEIRKNKNQLDLDVKNIFKGLDNATLIYKRKIQTGNLISVNEIQLIRFLASINTQINFTDDPTRNPGDTIDIEYHPSDIIDFTFGIGFEKQKMNKRFVHYYGMDAIINYTKYDDDFSNGTLGGVIVNRTTTTDRLFTSIKVGINPLFGIKYYFTKRLSLGIETGFTLAYFTTKIIEIDKVRIMINGTWVIEEYTELPPVVSKGLITKFNNLRFVTVGYTF